MSEDNYEICIGVLTVSDRCASGKTTDVSGQNLNKLIANGIITNGKITASGCVSDDEASIIEALKQWSDNRHLHVILTTGGTGFSPRDVTPEAVKKVINREASGLSTLMTTSSLLVTPLAALSRPVCGIRNQTIIITLPGSAKGSEECLSFVAPVIPHAVDLLINRMKNVVNTHDTLQSSGVKPSSGGCSHKKSHHKCLKEISSTTKADISHVARRPRKSPYPMISVSEAQAIVMGASWCREPITIELSNAHGFVLAEDVTSEISLPPFRASIKDGYAVRSCDGKENRKVIGVVAAGDKDETFNDMKEPSCIRINTGAPVPSWSDAVVQVEDTELISSSDDGLIEHEIKIVSKPEVGQDIRPVGCDITSGETVLKKYTLLSAAEIGIAASVGAAKLCVYPKPIVGLLSTGNELQSIENGSLEPGRIFDSNMPVLSALLQLNSIPYVSGGISEDQPQVLLNSLKALLDKGPDIIVTTGSVSMGDRDMLRDVIISDFGATVHFAQVFMKPGKPTTFATFTYKGSKRLMIGLPGNPVSATVTANLYLIPLCRKMSGRIDYSNRVIKAKISHQIFLDPRPEYHRATLSFSDTVPIASTTGNQLSSRLLSCAQASALLVLPPRTADLKELNEGALVNAILIN